MPEFQARTRPETRECAICGSEVPSLSKRQPRRYCDRCLDFRKYARALERIIAGEQYKSGPAAQKVRVRLMRLANQVPRQYHSERDALGRFRA